MILLERTKPHQLCYMHALVRRLHPADEEFPDYHARLSNLEAGFYGEQRTDRELADFSIPHRHYLLHNMELLNPQGFTHQIDTIVFTPHFLLILEIKNMTGRLFYKPGHFEFGRIRQDGATENFNDPFEQAYRHQLLLESLLRSWNIHMPVEYAVVITNQNAVLDESLRELPIFHVSGLRRSINRLFIKYPEPRLTDAVFEQASKRLMAALHRTRPKRRVSPDRLKKGVLCPRCEFQNVMQYTARNWHCKSCNTKDKTALRQALDDYRLLINDQITNKAFREFVGIESISAASKILLRLGFEKIGDKRGAFYIIPEDCMKDK